GDTRALVLSVAELLINVEALDPQGSTGVPMSKLGRQARAMARHEIELAQETAAEGVGLVRSRFPSWRVESAVEADTPYAAIVRRGEDWFADVVVVGSHGRSALGRL